MPEETSIHCPACHAELIVTGLTGGQRVLCAKCRAAFSLAGEPPAQRVCPKARASLLLGLVSPLGLLLTGIPAIVLGLRALADIRRQPHALRGRVMAIGGIASGSFFGLTCVVVLAVFLIPLVADYVKDAWYTTIVPPGSSWNWRHPTDGVDPAISDPDFHQTFFLPDYDDSDWTSGTDRGGPEGGFGYGDLVRIDIGLPPNAKRFTAYFRHHFTTSVGFDHLYLSAQRDDGLIVYLDGVEVVRDNVGDGDEAYDLTATTTVSSGEETVVHRIPLKGTIGPGRHVLAISLHNRDGGSSDLRIAEISLRGR